MVGRARVVSGPSTDAQGPRVVCLNGGLSILRLFPWQVAGHPFSGFFSTDLFSRLNYMLMCTHVHKAECQVCSLVRCVAAGSNPDWDPPVFSMHVPTLGISLYRGCLGTWYLPSLRVRQVVTK